MEEDSVKLFTRSRWILPRGGHIDLITPTELATLERGTVLQCILGNYVTVGIDKIDSDCRFGYLAYGFPSDLPPKEELVIDT